MPPETISCTSRCTPSSWSASTAGADGGERRDAGVLDEHLLRGGGAALHAVEHDHVGAGLDRERGVEVGPRGADLDVDRLLPVGDLAQLADLDLEVVGPGPVRVAAGAALVDPLRQVAHLGHAVGDLLAEQHAAAARLRALADDDLDRVRAAQVVRVHPVARGQQLVDEQSSTPRAPRSVMPPSPVVVLVPTARRPPPERLLRGRRQRAEAHPRDRDRDLEVERLLGVAGAERDVRVAALAVALERVARHARAEEQQVVEVRHRALGAEAADVVDPLARGALDLVDHVAVEDRAPRAARPAAASALTSSLLARCRDRHRFSSARVVDVEVVELAGRAVAPESDGQQSSTAARSSSAASSATCSSRISFSMQSAPRPATLPRT